MKSFLKDESGISWGLSSIFLLLTFGGAMYLFFTPIINGILDVFNVYIGFNMVSQDTADAVTFGANVWIFYAAVTIFGLFAWIVVRAHDRSDY